MKRQNDIDIKVPTLMHTYHLEKYLALVILAAAKILKRNASILLNLRSEEAINLLFFQINCKSRCAQRNTNRRMDPSKLIKYLNIQDISAQSARFLLSYFQKNTIDFSCADVRFQTASPFLPKSKRHCSYIIF